MSRWSLFFLTVPVAGVAIFAAAEYVGWSLPPVQSSIGEKIDHLYYVVLAITGVTFIFTQLGLAFLLSFYAKPADASASSTGLASMIAWLLVPLVGFAVLLYYFPMPADARLWMGIALGVGWPLMLSLLVSGRSVRGSSTGWYVHGNNTLEAVWTIVPAVIFIALSIYQYPVWKQLRYSKPMPEGVVPVRVIGRQFEWRMVYPGRDGKFDTADDLMVANELHVVKGQEAWIDLRAMDVLHSFFLPMHRIKQDAVPGLTIPVWFDCLESTWDHQAKATAYRAEDILNPSGLRAFLESHAEEVKFKDLKARMPAQGTPEQMAGILNELVAAESLSEMPAADDPTLTADVRELARTNPSGERRRLLHRKYLDHLLGGEFVRPIGREFDIVCAELCGWGHYKMKGRLVVHDTPELYTQWLEERYREMEATQ